MAEETPKYRISIKCPNCRGSHFVDLPEKPEEFNCVSCKEPCTRKEFPSLFDEIDRRLAHQKKAAGAGSKSYAGTVNNRW